MFDNNLSDVIEWDIRNWSVALSYWEQNTAQDLSTALALEIGSGHGGLSLWMALHGSRVICSDVIAPSEEAIKKHARYYVSHLIEYESLDALNIPYREEFDIVFFKSVLGAIGRNDNKANQAKAISEIYLSLKQGGELFFAENLVASPMHKFFRKRFIRWGKTWRYVSVEEMRDFLSIFSSMRYRTIGFLGAFGRNERQRGILGAIDRAFLDSIVPKNWRYIVVGVARK